MLSCNTSVRAWGLRVAAVSLVLFLSAFLNACAHKVSRNLNVEMSGLSFTLDAPFVFAKHLLPPGIYRCRHRDTEGCYFMAPASLNERYLFNRGNTGGVYIEGDEAYVFKQDKHALSYYAHGIGYITLGGSGRFMVTERLPDQFLPVITFSKESQQ